MCNANGCIDSFKVKQLAQMSSHAFEIVRFQVGWAVGATIAQQIRSYDAVTLLDEVCDLMVPPMRRLWESMQEQEEQFLRIMRRGEYVSVGGAGRELYTLCQIGVGCLVHGGLHDVSSWRAVMRLTLSLFSVKILT